MENEIRRQNGWKKDIHVHVRKHQSIGWRGAGVTIMESDIITNNYFVNRCTTSNLIKSRVYLQTSLLDTTKHPHICNVLFQKISIPPKEGNRISEGKSNRRQIVRGREVASPGLFPRVPYKIGNLLQTNSCPVEQALSYFTTPFAVHYEEICNHLRINQIQ